MKRFTNNLVIQAAKIRNVQNSKVKLSWPFGSLTLASISLLLVGCNFFNPHTDDTRFYGGYEISREYELLLDTLLVEINDSCGPKFALIPGRVVDIKQRYYNVPENIYAAGENPEHPYHEITGIAKSVETKPVMLLKRGSQIKVIKVGICKVINPLLGTAVQSVPTALVNIGTKHYEISIIDLSNRKTADGIDANVVTIFGLNGDFLKPAN